MTNEIMYYNSITEASIYLQQEIDDNEITEFTNEMNILRKALGELLRGFPTRKPMINKYSTLTCDFIDILLYTRNNFGFFLFRALIGSYSLFL